MTELIESLTIDTVFQLYRDGFVTDKARDYHIKKEFESLGCKEKSVVKRMYILSELHSLSYETIRRAIYRNDI